MKLTPRTTKPEKLSPSSINLYLEDPARWVLRYGYGIYGRKSAPMLKGIAVESGLQGYWWPTLQKDDLRRRDFALKRARLTFMQNLFDDGGLRDSKDELAYESLEDALDYAIVGVRNIFGEDPPMPLFQMRAQQQFTDAMPVEGFTDFFWPHQHVVADLKVTGRIPSEASRGHARQMAHYAHGSMDVEGTPPRVLLIYASDKKVSVVEPTAEQLDEGQADIYRAARSMTRLLRYDWEQMVEIFAPNFDSYVWCDESREAAERVWG